MIKTVVMGCGTIGSGVAEIPDKSRDVVASQTGQEVELEYVLDLGEFPDSPVAGKIIHNFKVIEQDEEVKIVMETTGGLDPTYPFVKACLMTGKDVIVSSKTLVAIRGTRLLAIVRRKYVNFFFEASVGGGVPIIRPLYRYSMGERIEEITGILSGTTSFILTKMNKEGESFEDALEKAQNLGYAERNPEVDAEGHDTCRRITILTAIVARKEVSYEDIYTESITRITDIDFEYAEKMRTSVKLFGTGRIKNGGVSAYVASVMINKTSPLCSANDVFSGILMKGSMLGTFMFYGSGAGKLPMGSAVVADIIEAVQNLKKNVPMSWTDEKQAIESMDQAQFRYFVRTAGSYYNKGQDVKNAFDQVEAIKLYGTDEFVFLTAQVAEDEFRKAAVSYSSREQERSEYGIKQVIRAVLQHMASVISRIIGEIVKRGFPCLFHFLTELYCLGCGSTKAFRALLVGNLLLNIQYHPLVAYMTVVLTVELVSFAVSRAARNPRYYPGHEKLLIYTGAVIALVNWVYKNYMLVVRDADLLPLWPHWLV